MGRCLQIGIILIFMVLNFNLIKMFNISFKSLRQQSLDNNLVSFIESNKGLVIQLIVSEVISVVRFVRSKLKTMIIDIKEKF